MSWWGRFVGTRDRLGWWTLPIFVMVGLAGAILAGTLATVYYGQQVDALKDETAAGRDELRTAVEDVREAGQEALDAIGSEVDAVREALDRELPLEDVAQQGVVSVRAQIGPEVATPPEEPEDPEGGQTEPEPGETQAEEPPQPTYREERRASGFAVAEEGEIAFIATAFSVVADPEVPGGVSQAVEVSTPAGTFPATVHSWDQARDLALLRAEIGDVEILRWRPADEELAVGSRVVVAGVTPALQGVQLAGSVGYVDVTALVTDLPPAAFLRGAPIVDDAGLVVAVYATAYAPFGPAAGPDQASVPARLLCERMLRNCEALEAEDGAPSPSPSPTG